MSIAMIKRMQAVLLFILFAAIGATGQGKKKFVVAQDGSGDFTSVQQAFDAIPAHNRIPCTIYIKNGIYTEKLHLDTTKDFVTLVGQDRFKTILSYDDHPGKRSPDGKAINTRSSHSFLMAADDFVARNITIRNDAGFTAGQAVALEVRGDKAVFLDCRITGFQDVLFTNNPESREYFKDCYIEGTTDFIFGSATAYFDQCRIHSKKNSHVTAASTPKEHPFGYVFYDCELTGDTTVTNASLGRPWRPYASVTYIHCYLGAHLRPEGWSNWNQTDNYKTARFSEYENYGPGASPDRRVLWSHQLTDEAVTQYSISHVLGGWLPPGARRDGPFGKDFPPDTNTAGNRL